MLFWQQILITIFGIGAFISFVMNFHECRVKKNAFKLTFHLSPLYGAFVCADAVVFGLFWTIVSLSVLLLNDWILFLLIFSVFWLVRSIGETIYWFLQQFSTIHRNPPENLFLYHIFHNDSIWFVYQIFWQCITVATAIITIYLTKLWLFH